jgi:adenylate kinase
MPHKPKKKVEEKKEVNPDANPAGQEQEEKPQETEEQEEQKVKPKFEKDIYPESFIMLKSTNELVMSRYQKSSQKISVDALKEQLELYNMLNMIDMSSLEENGLTVWNFFQERKNEIIINEIREQTDFVELYEAIRLYVERNGRPFNFLESETKVQIAREQSLHKREEGQQGDTSGSVYKNIKEEEELQKEIEAQSKQRWKEISDHEQAVKEAQQISTRYLLIIRLILKIGHI